MANICIVGTLNGQTVMFDPARWIDISLHFTGGVQRNAFHLPVSTFVPFRAGSFVGSIEEGGCVRCDVVTLAPHGNGTHTECVGHIAGRGFTIVDCMKEMADIATLVTVPLAIVDGVSVVTREALEHAWTGRDTTTLIIRTTPNNEAKRLQQWSGANPPFMHVDAMHLVVENGIRHLMIDLPSVDAEEDAGALIAHHFFWQWPAAPRADCTITELIYVPDSVADGIYLMLFNVAPFDGDAAPSRPVLLQRFA